MTPSPQYLYSTQQKIVTMQSRRPRTQVIAALCFAAISAPALAGDDLSVVLGKALFERIWVPAPSSTRANDGLGPVFNARSCTGCHRAATAGLVETEHDDTLIERGAVVRLSGSNGAPDPHYGAQIQTRAVPQFDPEARITLRWRREHRTLADGTTVNLRRPQLQLREMRFGVLAPTTRMSLTVAPSLAVASQIAKVDARRLRAQQGNGRLMRDGDGRAVVLGRKAVDSDIAAATALAFSRDLGMSTTLYPQPSGDCTQHQAECRAAPNGATPSGVEIGDEIVAALAAYVQSLPQPSTPNASNVAGRRAFEAAGCAACHQPRQSGRSGEAVTLYSDLQLHDMGDALRGPAESNGASEREWRTAPLLGLNERLEAGATLLHDGRARTIEEAILWHDGEAAAARISYSALPKGARAALSRFLKGK